MSRVLREIKPQNISVPWTGLDVLLFLAVWLLPLFASVAIAYIASQPQTQATAVDQKDHGHPIAQLIEQGKNSPIVFLVVFLSAVVVAPLVEEFLFRMLFQGWLEAKLKQLQIRYASSIAIVVVSCLFAAIHMNNHGAIDVQALLKGLAISGVFSLAVFMAGIIYLIQIRNVRIADYLFCAERLIRPGFFTCAGYCLLAIVFCLALNAALATNYPGTNVAPVPIFFFSLALGILYNRTQKLSDCILLHASLNGISLMLVWFGAG